MQLNRADVVEHLQRQGRADDARRAETELPESFDVENPPPLLPELGVDAKQLLGAIGSGTGEVPTELPS